MIRTRVFALLSLLVLITVPPAFAQSAPEDSSAASEGSISSILNGGVGPQTLQMKDLDNTWQVFRLSGSGSEGNTILDIYLVVVGQPAAQNTFYTQGKTITISDQTFLIAYHLLPPPVDQQGLARIRQPQPSVPLTPETVLSLCLVNIRSIGVMNDIHTFDPSQIAPAKIVAPAPTEQQGVQAESNLKQLALAMLQYCEDHNERFPPMKTAAAVKKALKRYAKTEAIFVDPRGEASFLPNPHLSGKSLADIDAPASTVAFWDPVADDQGRIYVAFADGHVKAVPADQWKKLKQSSKIP